MNYQTKNRIQNTQRGAASRNHVCGGERPFLGVCSALFISSLMLVVFGFIHTTSAAPNYEINYQGKLTNASNVAVADDTYNMRFWLTTSPSIATTSALWTEELTGANKVQVTNGLFSIMLGSTTPFTGVDWSQTLYLGVEIGGTSTPAWDGEMSPRKILGTVPSAFEAENARTIDNLATTSLLRSDVDDTASGLLTFTGGLISNSSTTITNLTTDIATTTTLVINGERFTNLLGTGLTNSGGTLTATLGTDITAGEIANGDHGFFSYASGIASLDTGGLTSADLLASLTDETGTGNAVFSTNPLLSGFRSFASSTIGDGTGTGGLTVLGNSTTTGVSYITTGLSVGSRSYDSTLNMPLQVYGLSGSQLNAATFRNTGGSVGSGVSISFTGANIDQGKIGTIVIDSNTADLMFTTRGSAVSSEKMRLTGGGNLGIGTTTPFAKFAIHANNGDTNSVLFEVASSTASATSSLFKIFNNGYVHVGSTGFRDSGSGQLMLIRSSDNTTGSLRVAGINTNGVNSDSTGSSLKLGASSVSDTSQTDAVLTAYGTYSQTSTPTNGFSAFRIAPIYNQSGSTASNTDLTILRTETAIGSGAQYLINAQTGGSLNAWATTTKFSVDRTGQGYFAGNVGIGSTSPNYTLDVNGTINASSVLVNGVAVGTGSGSVSSVDMSVPTGFAISGNPITTSGTLALTYDTGYEGLLSASSTNWNAFFDTPSTRISTGTGLSWSGNTLSNTLSSNWITQNGALTPSTTLGIRINASSTIGDGTGTGGLTILGNSTTTGSAKISGSLAVAGITITDFQNITMSSGDSVQWGSSLTRIYGGSAALNFITNSTNRLFIGQYGNIGVGTTTPESSFVIQSASSSIPVLTVASTSGSSLLTVLGNGNVGVGVASPAVGLHVYKNNGSDLASAYIQNASASGGAGSMLSLRTAGTNGVPYTQYYASGVGYWSTGYNTATGKFVITPATDPQAATIENSFYMTTAGALGLGTTTPSSKLTIEQGMTGTGNLFQIASSSNGTATSTLFIVDRYGNVGIGTTSPNTLLGVQGTVTAANFIAYSTTSTTTLAGGLDVGNGGLVYDLQSGETYIGSLISGTQTFDYDAGTVQWTDLPVWSAGLDTPQSYTASIGGNEMLTIYGLSSGASTTYNNMVGIGSSTPSRFLTVAGDSYFTNNIIAASSTLGYATSTSLYTGAFGLGSDYITDLTGTGLSVTNGVLNATGDGLSNWLTQNGALTPSTTLGIRINASSTIGDGTGAGGLTILGNSTTTGSASVTGALSSASMTVTSGNSYYLGGRVALTNTGTTMSVGTDSTWTGLGFGPGLTAKMFINSSGNVGIGTTTPASTLTIQGSGTTNPFAIASSTGDNLLSINSSGILDIRSGTSSQASTNIFVNGGPATTTVLRNIALGFESLANITTGANNNIAFGYQALNGSPTAKMTGYNNFAAGYQALMSNTTGSDNIANGYESLKNNTTGSGNISIGSGYSQAQNPTLGQNTTGYANIALGMGAGAFNTEGSNNIFFGTGSGSLNTTGSNNITNGAFALFQNTTGSYNLASGYYAGTAIGNTATSSNNIFLGAYSGYNQTQGDNNIFLGYDSRVASTTGSNQLSIGNLIYGLNTASGASVSTGTIGIGTTTPESTLTIQGSGTTNPFTIASSTGASMFSVNSIGQVTVPGVIIANGGIWGSDALYLDGRFGANVNINSIWKGNVGIGTSSPTASLFVQGASSTIPVLNVASSTGASLFTVLANGNVGIGSSTPVAKLSIVGTGGSSNVFAFASSTGSNLLTLGADGRMIFGNNASADIFLNGGKTTANPQSNNNNVAIGNGAFTYYNTGSNNIALGYQALYGSSTLPGGTANIALGYKSQFSTASGSSRNVSIGESTLENHYNGIENTAIGYLALRNDLYGESNTAIGAWSLYENISGGGNTAVGYNALYYNTTGSDNNALGTDALGNNTTGSNNNAFGSWALYANTTGATSTAIGQNAGGSNITGSFNTFIGANAGYFDTFDDGVTRVGAETAPDLYNATALGTSAQVRRSHALILGGTGLFNVDIGIGTTTPWAKLSIQNNYGSTTPLFDIATTTSSAYATSSLFRVNHDGNIGIGTSTPLALLNLDKRGLSGSLVGGMKEYLNFVNSTASAVYYGNEAYFVNAPTATSTFVGDMIRIEDTSTLGNTVRGLEAQAFRGTNTKGENTGLSGFGRTFGVRGTTLGDAGSVFVPAGIFADSQGTTQGNALRAYSGTLTTEDLVSFFHDGSAFSGTGLSMNFGNSGGSFAATSSAKFLDFQVSGTSKFTITAAGTTTIGDGTTLNMAGLQIGFGGLCVDNDGACTASTTGRITSVSSASGNSDLAEMYFSSDALEAGEIVSLVGGLSVGRASGASAGAVIGVISTKPGLIMGFDDTSLVAGEVAYPVALKGRVPIKLSTENGPIIKGDRIALSSIPGIGMKAKDGDTVVGIALEDYSGEYAYSVGYLNQFGDDLVKAKMQARSQETDARTQDGCSYGGGNAQGEAQCVKDKVSPIKPVVVSVDTRTEALRVLKAEEAISAQTTEGQEVTIGQAIMFVHLHDFVSRGGRDILAELSATSSVTNGNGTETLWSRVKALAQNFVDGVLRVTGIKTEELCVGSVCVDEATFLRMVENAGSSQTGGDTSTDSEDVTTEEGGGGEGDSGGSPVEETPVVEDQSPVPEESAPIIEVPPEELSVEEVPPLESTDLDNPDSNGASNQLELTSSEEPAPTTPEVTSPEDPTSNVASPEETVPQEPGPAPEPPTV